MTTLTTAYDAIEQRIKSDTIRLDWTDYRDELPDEIVAEYMTPGGVDWSEHLDYLDAVEDTRREYAEYDLNYYAEKAGVDLAELSDDERDDLTFLILDLDTFDWVDALMSNSGRQLIRVNLGDLNTPDGDYPDGDYNATMEARAREIARVVDNHGGMISPGEALELAENGPYYWHEGVRLDVIFSADVPEFTPDRGAGAVTFTDPWLLLIDPVNGSGHDVQLTGTMTVEFESGDFALDSQTPGYSWNDVAGVYGGAYSTEYTIRHDVAR